MNALPLIQLQMGPFLLSLIFFLWASPFQVPYPSSLYCASKLDTSDKWLGYPIQIYWESWGCLVPIRIKMCNLVFRLARDMFLSLFQFPKEPMCYQLRSLNFMNLIRETFPILCYQLAYQLETVLELHVWSFCCRYLYVRRFTHTRNKRQKCAGLMET